jgi:hypothetical protein
VEAADQERVTARQSSIENPALGDQKVSRSPI